MNRRLLLVLVCAAVVGLVASALVYRTIVQIATPVAGETSEPIVVAAANMTLAQTVTSQHVKLTAWPKSSIPSGAIRGLAEAEGRVVRSSIVAGEPLLEGKLAPQLTGRGGIMPMLVPEGQRGVTIKVDEAIRESGFVLPNSTVDVLVSLVKPGSQEKIAKLILQDVLVLAAGQAVEMRDNKPVTVTTVTLALTPDQTERLAVAQNEGRLMIATRNLRDKELVQTRGVTPTMLLADGAPAAPKDAKPATVARAPRRPSPVVAGSVLSAPRVQAHSVSVVRGGRVSEQVFVRIDDQQWAEQKDQKRGGN